MIILSPFAPHISEELWNLLGHEESVTRARFPEYQEKYLAEESFEYPIMINGKLRTKISFPVDADPKEMESQVLADEQVLKWTGGNKPQRIVIVPNRIVNLVVK